MQISLLDLCKSEMMNKQMILGFFLIISSFEYHAQSPIYSSESIHHPIIAENGMVASQHPLATQVGIDILKQGGNAIDASVGVGFALAVVLPRAGNLGGGGFMILHHAQKKKTSCINYREMAPSNSSRDMYLDKEGNVDNDKFNQSYHSIGVPGTVAGLIHALENYGSMSLKDILQPVIKLAEVGFPVSHDLSRLLKKYEDRLKKCPESKRIFYQGSGYYSPGDILIQKDLAWSLKQIAKNGKNAFYNGKLGKRISEGIIENGGIITEDDLENYIVEEVQPVIGTYRDFSIASMPPPSSGGVHLIQMLNILENYPISFSQHNSSETIHLMAEAMRLAYADRSEHLGDPNFWNVPMDGIISKDYAKFLNEKIDRYNANLSSEISAGQPQDFESEETTHFSVVDKLGNVVSNTYTLNFSFGSGLMAKGTGILLNNEMGDFSAKPGSVNAYGLIGGEANSVAPKKRPLSSMTPTLVFKNGQPILATGSPGGSRIITTVLQIIMNVIDHNLNIAEATHAPRVHHQWYPDILYYEKSIGHDTRISLAAKGHKIEQRAAMGSTQSIMIIDDMMHGCSDPRRPDATTMGF